MITPAPRSVMSLERSSLDLWQEFLPLLRRNNEETGIAENLDPNQEMYDTLDGMGILRCFTLRLDGELIGYCIMIVTPFIHQRGIVHAVQDAFYIVPEHRRSFTAVRFLRWIDDMLKGEVDQIIRQSCVKRPIDALLQRLGYSERETVYIKEI